ncbi:helix-turn-helix domain-containing protein [Rhodococcus erythropolis]|uniref:winged helix-turn-helix transcriptional regulator n=1 Tax=Rhodococcus erythropolis TaxID=1833 RepID=UPI00294A0887|nr:helix-turn-helix domain-containing protein [Rhodococcus erythropolis]MDV6277070.1 helix-turn-helix domain-containing protein [Rhodococcus erythropolis]
MRRTSFERWPCSIARTMDLVGDAWTPLVLREVFYGTTRFDDFQHTLGIARNTLTDRLRRLVDEEMLTKRRYQEKPDRYDYELTDKGRDFFPVLAAMNAWGDKWTTDSAGVPVVLRHEACGHDTVATVVCSECSVPLQIDDVTARLGPGYPEHLISHSSVGNRFTSKDGR